MENLNELVGQTVTANFEIDENGSFLGISAKVKSVTINDYYFQVKGMEPIYITLEVEPLEELPEEIDIEDLFEVPLENIHR